MFTYIENLKTASLAIPASIPAPAPTTVPTTGIGITVPIAAPAAALPPIAVKSTIFI